MCDINCVKDVRQCFTFYSVNCRFKSNLICFCSFDKNTCLISELKTLSSYIFYLFWTIHVSNEFNITLQNTVTFRYIGCVHKSRVDVWPVSHPTFHPLLFLTQFTLRDARARHPALYRCTWPRDGCRQESYLPIVNFIIDGNLRTVKKL